MAGATSVQNAITTGTTTSTTRGRPNHDGGDGRATPRSARTSNAAVASSITTSSPMSNRFRGAGLLVNSSSTASVTRNAPGATAVADVVSMSTLGSRGAVARVSSVPSRKTVRTASSGPASAVRSGTAGSSGSGVAPWYSGRPVLVPLTV